MQHGEEISLAMCKSPWRKSTRPLGTSPLLLRLDKEDLELSIRADSKMEPLLQLNVLRRFNRVILSWHSGPN